MHTVIGYLENFSHILTWLLSPASCETLGGPATPLERHCVARRGHMMACTANGPSETLFNNDVGIDIVSLSMALPCAILYCRACVSFKRVPEQPCSSLSSTSDVCGRAPALLQPRHFSRRDPSIHASQPSRSQLCRHLGAV